MRSRGIRSLRAHSALLQRCRVAGSDSAFAEAAYSADVEPLSEILRQSLGPTGQPQSRELTVAIGAARQLLRHHKLWAFPSATQASLENLAAIALMRVYEVAGSPSDLDDAIAALREAVLVTPMAGLERARYLNNRSNCFSERYVRTGKLADLNASLADIEEALGIMAARSPDRAALLNNHSHRLAQKYARNGNLALIDAALTDINEAMELTNPSSIDRAALLDNRANRLSDRYGRTSEAKDLQSALIDMEDAVAVTPPSSPDLPIYLNDWAARILDEYARTGRLKNLDDALAKWSTALQLTPAHSLYRPSRLSNRASGFLLHFHRTGDMADLEAALADLRSSVALTPATSPDRAMRLNNKATALAERYGRTRNLVDLNVAIDDLRDALSITPADSPDRAMYLGNWANLFMERFARTANLADLNFAVARAQESVSATPRRSRLRAGHLCDLANGLSLRHEKTGSMADLKSALAALNDALDLTPPGRPLRPVILASQARNLALLYAHTSNTDDLEAAVAAYGQACRTGLRSRPLVSVTSAHAWSTWATARHAWAEVAEAGELGLMAADRLVRVQASRDHKESYLRDAQGLAVLTSYAWARLGSFQKAVIAAERGRAVLLADALTLRATLEQLTIAGHDGLRQEYESTAAMLASDASTLHWRSLPSRRDTPRDAQTGFKSVVKRIRALPDFRGFLVRPRGDDVLARVVAAAFQCNLVYLMAAAPGGMMLVARADGEIKAIELPELTEDRLREQLAAYVSAYGDFGRPHAAAVPNWPAALDETTHWLGAVIGQPLRNALRESGSARAKIVSLGLLGVLPIHAACVEEEGATSDRRYLLDDVCIAYLPNAQAGMPGFVANDDHVDSILAVDEPSAAGVSSLAGSEREVASAVASFDERQATILRHEDATRGAVLSAMAGRHVIHFSCHGIASPDHPQNSRLLMADAPITVADLLASRLDGTRLVVLSACETAFPGARVLDEVVGLPTSLLQAGASAAIGSLWPVEPLATMALFSRFYCLWRIERLPLAEALRQAQCWVRDLRRDDREAAFPGVDFTASGGSGPTPYANPFWWAAFELTGS